MREHLWRAACLCGQKYLRLIPAGQKPPVEIRESAAAGGQRGQQ